MIALTCNYCESAAVIHFGKNASGTPRFRCKGCGKTWVLNPKPRKLSDARAAQVVAALAERISQRGQENRSKRFL